MSFDKSGYRIFSQGQLGAAHEAAHRALDSGDLRRGHDELAAFLAEFNGAGSEWLHLNWHLLVFELKLGFRTRASGRFDRVLRPHAAMTDLVATDAPAALWRMKLAGVAVGTDDFKEVRLGALRRLGKDKSAFVTLHDLLAFAGAGDLPSLKEEYERQPSGSALRVFTWACLALSSKEYRVAARCLAVFQPLVEDVGGSHAQNGMFAELLAWSEEMALSEAAKAVPRAA